MPKIEKQSPEHIRKRVESRRKTLRERGPCPAHNRYTTESFRERLYDRWPDFPYDWDGFEYVINDKIELYCKVHGHFKKYSQDVLNHSGCPKCVNQGFTKDEMLKDLASRFTEYDFSECSYINATTHMQVLCRAHGKRFSASRNSLINSGVLCPLCTKERLRQERIDKGLSVRDSKLTEFQKYRKECWKFTNIEYRKYKDYLGVRDRQNHLDHIYSIFAGFRDGIPPDVIGSVVNLRIIRGSDNQKKNVKCDFDRETLLERFANYEKTVLHEFGAV